MLAEREKLNGDIRRILDEQTDAWGIKVLNVARRPEAMQLRYLGALQNIAGEKSNTILFPIPMRLLEAMTGSATVSSDKA